MLFFKPLWDVLVKLVALCCILSWWDLVLFGRSEVSLWACLLCCCTIFVRDIVMRCHVFGDRYELCVWYFHALLASELCFWWCDVRTVERWMLKDAGDGVYTRWFLGRCVVLCVQVGRGVRWRGGGMNVSWVVVVRCKCKCKCECVGRQKGSVWKLSDSCHQHALHQVDTYVCLRMT